MFSSSNKNIIAQTCVFGLYHKIGQLNDHSNFEPCGKKQGRARHQVNDSSNASGSYLQLHRAPPSAVTSQMLIFGRWHKACLPGEKGTIFSMHRGGFPSFTLTF